jgi:hypothetical protein
MRNPFLSPVALVLYAAACVAVPVDTFTVGGHDSDVLSRSRDAVTGRLHEGEVVDVTTADGSPWPRPSPCSSGSAPAAQAVQAEATAFCRAR